MCEALDECFLIYLFVLLKRRPYGLYTYTFYFFPFMRLNSTNTFQVTCRHNAFAIWSFYASFSLDASLNERNNVKEYDALGVLCVRKSERKIEFMFATRI